MGQETGQKKAVDRKRPNPDSPNLTGTTDAINRTLAMRLEEGSSSSGVRGDASPAKKPCVDNKQLPGQVPTPNQYIQQQDPNRMGANHQAQPIDNGVTNQMVEGASVADSIEGVQALDLLNDIGNTDDFMRLLDDPNGTQLDEMMKSGQFNPDTILSELARLENNLSKQLGEMPDIATNSPRSQDPNKQSEMKPDTGSNSAESGVVFKTENSDSYDPMMRGPPNTVATEAVPKGGPLPSIIEFKPNTGKNVMIKQEPQQISASQAARAAFNGQNVQTAVSSGAQNIVPQVNHLTSMQATATSASVMNPSLRGSFVSGASGQQGNFLNAQQQQQLNSRQFLQNAPMANQQNPHSRMPNPVLNSNMNPSMTDQLTQFANNAMRGQSPQHGRLPSIMQSFIQDRGQNMALSSGQAGNMLPGQASQFVGHPQQSQRTANPEILQRLQNPPHYNAGAEQRKFMANSYGQSPQQGHNMQQGNNQMLIPRRPPPRYDETPHRNSMPFQGTVNQGMPQQLGQQGGMMTHMGGQPNVRSITPGTSLQGHPNNGMAAGGANLAPHSSMMQGMAQQQPQQRGLMSRLTPQLRRQQMMQQNMRTMQQSAAMGNQMNMGTVPPSAVNMGQAGVAQYHQRHLPGQWPANQLLQQRMQQQTSNFQGNNMMQQSYSTQSRFPQRNVMDSGSNMRTFQNITSQGGISNATNTNPSIMAQQQFVGQPQQSQQQQAQQPTQQQQQQPQQQPVQGNPIAAMQNGSSVSATNQTFGNNAQQMQMAMIPESNNQQPQQQQQQQSGSTEMLELLDNIIKNDGTPRTNSHV
ncbi:putative mediator of RNA polymerase II transcription subunit 26 [Lytechinus pictus]|uniref:putative mediator of RNA polymerase II transcription subunit 26 n=1 Tax=Lytechinus pictus TaxID=7653 RepID=UPI0030BA0F61